MEAYWGNMCFQNHGIVKIGSLVETRESTRECTIERTLDRALDISPEKESTRERTREGTSESTGEGAPTSRGRANAFLLLKPAS